jgi:hypothetical protein
MEDAYNNTPFINLTKEDIANDLNSVYSKANEILTRSPQNLVAKTMIEKIEQYRKMLPFILKLANPSIKPRHWAKLFDAVKQPYDEESTFTLAELRQYNILNREFFIHDDFSNNCYLEEAIINEISTLASGEFSLETSLEKIENYWDSTNFQLIPYHKESKNIHARPLRCDRS